MPTNTKNTKNPEQIPNNTNKSRTDAKKNKNPEQMPTNTKTSKK